MSLLLAESAIRALDQGLVAWEFRPHGESRKDTEALTAGERRLVMEHECRDDAMISRVLASTRDVRKRYKNLLYWYGNNCGVWPTMFQDRATSCIVITPKWSAQGPNGSLVVTKGPRYTTAHVNAFKLEERKLETVKREAALGS